MAAPIVLTQVAHISLSFVDTIMVGRLGPESLAGIALGNSFFSTLIVIAMGIVMAVGPMVAPAFGAGQDDPIGRSLRPGLWPALSLALVGQCRLTVSKPVFQAPMVSALEATI